MIINQILFLIFFIYNFIILTYLWLVPIYFFPNKYEKIKKAKCIYENMALYIFYTILQAKFYINKESKKYIINDNLDKIDVVISNHIGSFDFIYIIEILKKFGIDNTNFIFKSDSRYIFGLGFSIYTDTDIMINKKWEEDKELINKQINRIEPGTKKEILIIFPEGTRITEEKIISSQKYSRENNLPVYDYLQVPKSKGLWNIIDNLSKNNKLGKIWDITIIRPKYLREPTNLIDIATKPIRKIYTNIRELTLPDNYHDMDIFKKWLHEQWVIKDNIIKNYKSISYKKLEYNYNLYNKDLIICLFAFIFMCYLLSNKYGRRYLLFIIIVSYIILYNNKKLK